MERGSYVLMMMRERHIIYRRQMARMGWNVGTE